MGGTLWQREEIPEAGDSTPAHHWPLPRFCEVHRSGRFGPWRLSNVQGSSKLIQVLARQELPQRPASLQGQVTEA
jgi:hypothetical protein